MVTMYKPVVVYKGEEKLGDVLIYPQEQKAEESGDVVGEILKKEIIRISYFSQPSERCPPLAVLHTITSSGVCFKLECKNKSNYNKDSPLHLLHSSCIQDNKTAVASLGGMEIHLVAMHSRSNEVQHPCFWGFKAAAGLYHSCLVMLNLRCLGIVFDLDETLIVANTMRSFEDRMEALQRKINVEVDPQRVAGMLAEVKRYQDDKNILKQYLENDQFVDNGRVFTPQFELVTAMSDNHQSIVRPLIRLQEKNIILTRINPQIRDTSVLVRLRPAWEDLRSYLIAKGRKRFEVFVCTMAERDYAFEMWRLLDPECKLISSQELLDRIVCVKSGSRKSLFNVFQGGTCHPKMALVIDDRLKVWDEKDQSRIHVVPAFAPYFAPQAEENNDIPVLCVARNVACNVRGGFFKEFDEGLLQRIPEIAYEDNLSDIPSPPDVSKYLVSEDEASAITGNKDPVPFDGMADAEVERRLKEAISTSSMILKVSNSLDPRIIPSIQFGMGPSSSSVQLPASQPAIVSSFSSMQFSQTASLVKPMGQVAPPEPSFQSSPAREEGEVPESELDPDTRRRLLILQHGQDTRDNVPGEPQFPGRTSMPVSVPRMQPQGNWPVVEEEMSPRQLNWATSREFPLDPEQMQIEKHQHHQPFFPKFDGPIPSDRMGFENKKLPKEAHIKDDRLALNSSVSSYQSTSGYEPPLGRSSSNKDMEFEYEGGGSVAETPAAVLQEIAGKCGARVEFRSSLVAGRELLFSIEASFAGEKIGEGIGRTRREAQYQAAESSIRKLADIYVSGGSPDTGHVGDANLNDDGYLGPINSFGIEPSDEPVLHLVASESSRFPDGRFEGSKRSIDSVTGGREYVEIDGRLQGKEFGQAWIGRNMQEKPFGSSRMAFGQFTPKHQGSPRSMHGMPNKRLKPEFPRVMQRMPSSARYP